MAKKDLHVRGAGSLMPNSQRIDKEYPTIEINSKNDSRIELLEAGLHQYTPQNAPTSYKELKKEVKALAEVHAKTFVILAHRLKLIRDQELYKEDHYSDFKSFVDGELDIARSTVYNYISLVEIFNLENTRDIKTSNLFIALPFIRNNPDKKEEIYKASQRLGRKDFLVYLNSYKIEDKENESEEEENIHFYNSEEELINNSKFVRAGMKAKTVKSILKDMTNWFLIHEPKNKKIKKIIEALKEL